MRSPAFPGSVHRISLLVAIVANGALVCWRVSPSWTTRNEILGVKKVNSGRAIGKQAVGGTDTIDCLGQLLQRSVSRYRKFKRPFLAVCQVGGGRASARFGQGSGLRERHFGITWARSLFVRGYFSVNPGVGPSAPLRDRRRI